MTPVATPLAKSWHSASLTPAKSYTTPARPNHSQPLLQMQFSPNPTPGGSPVVNVAGFPLSFINVFARVVQKKPYLVSVAAGTVWSGSVGRLVPWTPSMRSKLL